jgi:precorrin-2 dehydrogenase/sirohydrochlorin ferrochelatase
MSKVCEQWSLQDLVEMEEKDMDAVLEFYGPGTVPSLKQVQGKPDFDKFEFDGSFGWF